MSSISTSRMGRGRNVYIAVHGCPLTIKIGQADQVKATSEGQVVLTENRLDGARVWTLREPATPAPKITRVGDRSADGGIAAIFAPLDSLWADLPRHSRSSRVTVEVPAGSLVHVQLSGEYDDQTAAAAGVIDLRGD